MAGIDEKISDIKASQMEVRFFCIQYSAAKKFFVCHSSQIAIVMAHINLSENTKLENEKKPIPEEDAKPEKAERRESCSRIIIKSPRAVGFKSRTE